MGRAGWDHTEGGWDRFPQQTGTQVHQALKAGEDLLDLHLDVPLAAGVMGRGNYLPKKHGIVVLNGECRRRGDPLVRDQAQTFALNAAELAAYLTFLAEAISGDLDGCAVGKISEGSHTVLFGVRREIFRGIRRICDRGG